jgi:glyoxylase-like metal-dependent hydrolase (beta-lactamase superfamily II)
MIEGERAINLGGLTLDCFTVGWHSPGNLAVHVPELDALMVSDSLGFHYPGRGFCPLFFTGYKDFLATLDRLAALKPAIVCPAHQGALTGQQAASAFEDAHRTATEFRSRIIDADPADDANLFSELFHRFYKDEFKLYSPENIGNCIKLLIRRVRESNPG